MKNGQVIDKNQIYNNDYCNNPNCTVYINVFWDIIENFSEDGCYLVGFDGNGKSILLSIWTTIYSTMVSVFRMTGNDRDK